MTDAGSLTQALLGTWRIVSWTVQYDDGTVRHPFGTAPSGVLIYCADGGMAVCLHDSARVGDMPAFAYAGRFEVSGGSVVHEIASCTVDRFIGSSQVRDVTLRGGALTLSARDDRKGRSDSILWRRASGG